MGLFFVDKNQLINPFIAMLVAPSVGKRPKSAKSETIKAFLPISHEQVKGFLPKCTVLKVDLLQDHQIYCLEACMCALFSPEISQAGAVKGL